jgi:hypothetical protein
MKRAPKRRGEKTVTLPCPAMIHEEDCGADVVVTLEWNSGEVWGSDADGNRGEWRDGYWSVTSVGTCEHGHTLDHYDEDRLVEEAEEEARDDEQDAYDYDGPDGPDDE